MPVRADRVAEYSYSTGLSHYVLRGPVPGFRTFGSVASSGSEVYYCATGEGRWEVGLGRLLAPGNIIQRLRILASSNSNNAVNWDSSRKEIHLVQPAETALPRCSFGQVSTPGPLDDKTKGYDVGSLWSTSGQLFVCLSAAENAAQWAQLATVGFNGLIYGDGSNLFVTSQSSSTPVSLAERFSYERNVKDFGAVGNGVANDVGAFSLAVSSRPVGSPVLVRVPYGQYNLPSAVPRNGRFPSYIFDPGAGTVQNIIDRFEWPNRVDFRAGPAGHCIETHVANFSSQRAWHQSLSRYVQGTNIGGDPGVLETLVYEVIGNQNSGFNLALSVSLLANWTNTSGGRQAFTTWFVAFGPKVTGQHIVGTAEWNVVARLPTSGPHRTRNVAQYLDNHATVGVQVVPQTARGLNLDEDSWSPHFGFVYTPSLEARQDGRHNKWWVMHLVEPNAIETGGYFLRAAGYDSSLLAAHGNPRALVFLDGRWDNMCLLADADIVGSVLHMSMDNNQKLTWGTNNNNVILQLTGVPNGFRFEKLRDNITARTYAFNDLGGLYSDTNGPENRGMVFWAPTLTISGSPSYHNILHYFAYNSLTNPTLAEYNVLLHNSAGLTHLPHMFRISNRTAPTGSLQLEAGRFRLRTHNGARLPRYANDSAALSGGLSSGDLYVDTNGFVREIA